MAVAQEVELSFTYKKVGCSILGPLSLHGAVMPNDWEHTEPLIVCECLFNIIYYNYDQVAPCIVWMQHERVIIVLVGAE